MPETAENWKAMLQQMKGRTITGFATGAMGGRLGSLTITFDEGPSMSFSIEPGAAEWDGVHIKVERG